jgi:hypothetical protein
MKGSACAAVDRDFCTMGGAELTGIQSFAWLHERTTWRSQLQDSGDGESPPQIPNRESDVYVPNANSFLHEVYPERLDVVFIKRTLHVFHHQTGLAKPTHERSGVKTFTTTCSFAFESGATPAAPGSGVAADASIPPSV